MMIPNLDLDSEDEAMILFEIDKMRLSDFRRGMSTGLGGD